jgi:hypothetical protein
MNKKISGGINRRSFLGYGTAALAGATIPGVLGATVLERDKTNKIEMGKTAFSFKKNGYKEMVSKAKDYKKIDVHNHTGDLEDLIESMDRVGIQWSSISDLSGGRDFESMKNSNDIVLRAIKKYPNRILGQCRINPGYPRESIEEIDRCVDQGMVMLGELYDEYKINDPVYFPIIERCIHHKIPLLVHAAATLGLWREGYSTMGSSRNTSTAEDFVEVGQRYPEAMIICAHIGGGGDWEYAVKVLREAPSIYADTSGSVADEAMIDLAIKHLGVDRLLFGTDVNYEAGVGKVMCANLTDEERKKIFYENFNGLLRKGGNNVS